jgi:hypothetical protein
MAGPGRARFTCGVMDPIIHSALFCLSLSMVQGLFLPQAHVSVDIRVMFLLWCAPQDKTEKAPSPRTP